jgi:chromosome partitioning protein
MRILVFASQKGGSGKTTLAGHVAVEAERQGAGPVALIDTDPQGSLAKWWNVRQDPAPAFIQSVFSNLFHDLDRARDEGFKLVVIDTPPAVTRAISEVVGFADIVIAPTRPSPHDLRAVGPTVEITNARAKPLIFVVNAATAQARITSEAAIALSQHGTVAPTVIHHRVDYAAAMIDGRTVMEIDPVCKSALEVGELWSYIHSRLKRLDGAARGADDLGPAVGGSGGGMAGRVFGRRAAQ